MSEHSSHAHYHPPAKLYAAVLAALLALTIITVTAAGINFGSPSVNVVIAMVIATIKASLVVLFFMHLKYDRPINGLIFLSGVFFLGLFLTFCILDTGARPNIVPANKKEPDPPSLKVAAPGAPVAPAAAAPAAAAPAAEAHH